MTSRGDMTDRDLLQAYVVQGDLECLGAFVERHQGSLLRFASRFLGDFEAAQDVVQETFLQVSRNPKRLLGVENHHNWLLTVTRNLSISRIRRDSRARKHTAAFAERLAASPAAEEEPAGKALEDEELRSMVYREIHGLDRLQREVLLLKVEEKSYREIAAITGLSVTYVGYLVYQAVKKLSMRLNHSREDFT